MFQPLISALALALLTLPAAAQTAAHTTARTTALRVAQPAAPPGLQCRAAITAAERAASIPPQLMAAIGRVESGRPDGRGAVHPWPWTINAEGTGRFFESKDAAIAETRALLDRGVRSIDVGCMQVNLMHHPDAFTSLDQAFDPAANAGYAARFLTALYAETRDWTRATAFYHSQTPEFGDAYQKRVAAIWPEEQRRGGSGLGLDRANVWTRNAFTANAWNSRGAPLSGALRNSGRPVSSMTLAGRRL